MADRDNFGQRLRRERERRGITLEQIAADSKVAVDLWQGLERGDLSRWPSGIFARSFVRTYAARVGLPARETLDEFCRLYPLADRRAETIIRAQAETIGVASEYADDRARAPRAGDRRVPSLFWSDPPGTAIAQRAVIASLDLTALLLLSLAVSRIAGRDLWSTIGLLAILYYPLGFVAGGTTPAGLLIDVVRHRVGGLGPRIAAEKPRVSHG